MSFNIRSIREISTDPTTKFISHLAKRISDLQNASQQEDLENKEDIYSSGQDVESFLGFHSDLTSTKVFDFETEYYPPTEPDGDKLRVWLRGTNIGNDLKDWSGEDIETEIHGEPSLIDGTPFDLGIHTGGIKSTALRCNVPDTPHESQDYFTITHTNRSRASEGLATGISFFIRFRVHSLAQDGGKDATLYEKFDNTGITDGVEIRLSAGGRVKFHVKNTNVEYNMQTTTGTIVTDTVYDVWCTYAKSGNVQHIYVNNVDKSLSASDTPDWHSDTSNYDATVFSIGAGTAAGSVYGDLYDFRMYREKVVSATEVSRMYTNKWTIADIPFGQVMISDYWATYDPSTPGESFTSTSYTSTSYTTP